MHAAVPSTIEAVAPEVTIADSDPTNEAIFFPTAVCNVDIFTFRVAAYRIAAITSGRILAPPYAEYAPAALTNGLIPSSLK